MNWHEALTLSSISTTVSYNTSGLATDKSKMLGLDWFPITKQSLKPLVVTRAQRAPFLSNKAFVATVVPNLKDSMFVVSNGSPLGILVLVNISSSLLTPSKFESG
ncbi:unnamed protein product [Ambrosiozyma monospora]|uniref:Unnamed protein product n=1 Tax=Ambrosiozyma monospora TaxID=43982 RepID=A0ACB5U7T6_AMBMO|nr:unnamed protein product [Ambrosiozyma monospora]